MSLEEAIIVLNTKKYRGRTNWRIAIPVHACEANDISVPPSNTSHELISCPQEQYDRQRHTLDEFGAIAIAEKYQREQIVPSSYPLLYGSPGDGEYPIEEE